MTIRIACNLVLDSCGILILLLYLLPLFLRKHTWGFNRRKMSRDCSASVGSLCRCCASARYTQDPRTVCKAVNRRCGSFRCASVSPFEGQFG